jgi:hypothetical protein
MNAESTEIMKYVKNDEEVWEIVRKLDKVC